MIWLRSICFYLLLAVLTIIFTLLGIIILPLDFKLRFKVMSRWSALNFWSLKHICKLDYRVEGIENIPQGPAIIMCKHQSAWETLALQIIFPPQVWVLKRELLRIPIYGWGLATMKPIAIDRSAGTRAIRQLVSDGRKRLEQGNWVVIFPEGTRIAPGSRGEYQPGGGLLSAKTGFPIVPVSHNAGHFWPSKSLIKRPGTINMVIGPTIYPDGKSATEITQEAEEWIESEAGKLPIPNFVTGP
jgi:1-acyl-sn-glycerol-3-phosphate acyltransferase